MARPASHLRQRAEAVSVVSRILRARRRDLGLTQQDVAELAGVGVRLVHEVEHGSEAVRLGNLRKILAVLGLQLAVTALDLPVASDDGSAPPAP